MRLLISYRLFLPSPCPLCFLLCDDREDVRILGGEHAALREVIDIEQAVNALL